MFPGMLTSFSIRLATLQATATHIPEGRRNTLHLTYGKISLQQGPNPVWSHKENADSLLYSSKSLANICTAALAVIIIIISHFIIT